ncbi:MAG: transposase [Ginsengibacter sp.]
MPARLIVQAGIDIFSRKEYRDIIVDSLNYCIKEKELVVYGWVIMSNHIHLIITTKTDEGNISGIMRDFKKLTSKAISKAIQEIPESRRVWLLNAMSKEAKRIGRATYYNLWKDDNHAVTIDGKIVGIKERLNYIHQNPVRNGLEDEPRIMFIVVQGIIREEKGLSILNLYKGIKCKSSLQTRTS